MSFWNVMKIGSSALSAQSLRLDVISDNIANAETTSTDAGGPYKRKDVVFTANSQNSFLETLIKTNNNGTDATKMSNGGVKVTQIVEDSTEGSQVYDPTHPDADENGYVTYPNVDLAVEMTNMISASRSYEASLNVIDVAKNMAMKALEIGA